MTSRFDWNTKQFDAVLNDIDDEVDGGGVVVFGVAGGLNGDPFTEGSEGEREELLAYRIVQVATEEVGGAARTTPIVREFIGENYQVLNGIPAANKPPMTPLEILRICHLRRLLFDKGLYRAGDTADVHHCRYKDFNEYVVGGGNVLGGAELVTWNNDRVWRIAVKGKVLDAICLCAFMMRSRGHHYLKDFKDRLNALWRKCQYDEDNFGLSWELLFHAVFHAIWPDDLDQLWLSAVNANICAGALKKRINVASAGTAGPLAIAQGLTDLLLILPRIRELAGDSVAYVEVTAADLKIPGNRWKGSVNRHLYGAPGIDINEALMAPLASCIRAALDNMAAGAAMLDSKAVKRIAESAPLTGAMIARMINAALKHERVGDNLLPQIEPID